MQKQYYQRGLMQNEIDSSVSDSPRRLEIKRYYKIAIWLGIITIVYNILEGLFSLAYGIADETITLFGFGVDSFIETLSPPKDENKDSKTE